MGEWVLTDKEKENIEVFEVAPSDDPHEPRGHFTWAYRVKVYGILYTGHRRHPTRRAANCAAKSFYKSQCRYLTQQRAAKQCNSDTTSKRP
jgi:hypothetical protein